MNTNSVAVNLMASTRTSTGQTLAELSERSPVLLVLLRHEGCTFCRNALSDIARLRPRLDAVGTRIVLGHMGSDEHFTAFANRYGLADVASISDPDRALYKGMGLRRGRLWQLLGPRVIWEGLKSTLVGHLPGKIKGDPYQLPGAFLLHRGEVIKVHAFRDASDRPDYVSLATV